MIDANSSKQRVFHITAERVSGVTLQPEGNRVHSIVLSWLPALFPPMNRRFVVQLPLDTEEIKNSLGFQMKRDVPAFASVRSFQANIAFY